MLSESIGYLHMVLRSLANILWKLMRYLSRKFVDFDSLLFKKVVFGDKIINTEFAYTVLKCVTSYHKQLQKVLTSS